MKDETDLKNQQRQIINLSVSYTIYDLHYLIGQKVKYKMGTFTLVWDKQVCLIFIYFMCFSCFILQVDYFVGTRESYILSLVCCVTNLCIFIF